MAKDATSNYVVSEILPDGRLIITGYVLANGFVTAFMDVYDDCTMRDGKRVLHVTLQNGAEDGQGMPLPIS